MGTLTDRIRLVGQQSAVPSEAGAGVGQINAREQAIIDRHKSKARGESLFQRLAAADAQAEIDARRQQRAYAEQAPPEIVSSFVSWMQQPHRSSVQRAQEIRGTNVARCKLLKWHHGWQR
jgi:hypothetical protein